MTASTAPEPTSGGGGGRGGAAAAASPATSERCSRDNSNSAAVGAGIGVPLGILLLAALAGMWFYRRKWINERDAQAVWRTTSSGEILQSSVVPAPSRHATTEVENRPYAELAHKRVMPSEIGDGRPAPRELR